jgi:acyl carrier protein
MSLLRRFPQENVGMSLHRRLETVFREILQDDSLELTDATSARDVPAWDSVMHVNLMFGIEQEFGVQFVGNELAEMSSIGDLKAYLASRSPDPQTRS